MPADTSKACLVTGAARGIGLATAKLFLDYGWRVALIDNNAQTLRAAEQSLPSDTSMCIDCDVSDPDQVQRAIDQTAAHFGRLDGLVNNAGIADFGPIAQTGLDIWNAIMATNLSGPFITVQAAVPVMLRSGGGAVVNVASISGHRASTLRVAYGTSKAGVIHLTKQQAAEYGNQGVRVNCICPGPVDTEMAKKVHDASIRQSYHDNIPLNRYGDEREIAEAIYFLISDKASYINGQILSVDGGFESTGIGLPDLRAKLGNT
jgi:NAD(P)-dependent dehydrogenase (short-subunit alcohol dehydrogenase family)